MDAKVMKEMLENTNTTTAHIATATIHLASSGETIYTNFQPKALMFISKDWDHSSSSSTPIVGICPSRNFGHGILLYRYETAVGQNSLNVTWGENYVTLSARGGVTIYVTIFG